MAETMQTLEELSTLKPAAAPQPPKYVQKLDKQGRAYATGKRKDAVARVWIKMGAGKIIDQRPPGGNLFCPAGAAHDDPAAAGRCRTARANTMSFARSRAADLSGQAGAVRHGTVEGADAARARSARRCSSAAASSPATRASSSARNTAAPKPAEASSSRSGNRHSGWGEAQPGTIESRWIPLAGLPAHPD